MGRGGDFGSGSGSKCNCAARVGSGQTVSGTGRVRASVEPVQTSNAYKGYQCPKNKIVTIYHYGIVLDSCNDMHVPGKHRTFP